MRRDWRGRAQRHQPRAADATLPMMARRRHGELSTMRPGSFGFPVLIASPADQETPAAASVSRSPGLVALAVAALLFFHWTGGTLRGSGPTMAACLAILLFGLPHGTLDLEIIKRERGASRSGMVGLLGAYLALAAAMATLWQLAPVGALSVFIVVAVVHFAEDWTDLGSAFLAHGMAIALLTAPALLHLADLELRDRQHLRSPGRSAWGGRTRR